MFKFFFKYYMWHEKKFKTISSCLSFWNRQKASLQTYTTWHIENREIKILKVAFILNQFNKENLHKLQSICKKDNTFHATIWID